MRPDQLAFQAQQEISDQMANLDLDNSQASIVPVIITVDTTLLPDYPKNEVDATAGDVTLTLTDASQINEFAWIIHRVDGSSNRVFVVAEDPAQLINGQTSWEIFPYETLTFSGNLDKYSVQ